MAAETVRNPLTIPMRASVQISHLLGSQCHRGYPVVAVGVGLVLPAVVAAQWGDPWGGLLVAGFLRGAVMLQATFCVNSLAHLVGTRRYDARSSARDSMLTALVTFGEG